MSRGRLSFRESDVACDDVRPARRFVVNGGTERRHVSEDLELIGVGRLELVGALPAHAVVLIGSIARSALFGFSDPPCGIGSGVRRRLHSHAVM
jgi:hypothetical protein